MSDTDPRIESLARHLARAAGHDENARVTGYEPQQLVAPQSVYAVPKHQFPVWMTYVLTAEAALEWLDAIEPEGEFKRGVAA